MRDIDHGASFKGLLLNLRAALRLEHIIGILGLTEHIHKTSIEGVGMITALMVKRMPQATSHMLPGCAVERIITGKGIGRGSIMLRLDQHGMFAPVAGHTAWRIM